MKKTFAIIFLILFALACVPALAKDMSACNVSTGKAASDTQKSIFQQLADGMAGWGKCPSREKKSLTGVFQKSSDYIEESSPKAKELSLRDKPDEVEARRMNQ